MLHQRSHVRSQRPAEKPYAFLRLPGPWPWQALAAAVERVRPPFIESQWKWHLGTSFCVLRGGPPVGVPGGELTSGRGLDTPVLGALPELRAFLDHALPARAEVAWLGLSPPDSCIHLHVDNTTHWDEHHRLHLPLVTTPGARLCVEGRFLHLAAGDLWALQNSRPHGALNAGPARLHLCLDLPPTPAVTALLAEGEPLEGEPDAAAYARLQQDPFRALTTRETSDPALMARLLAQ